jgi:hypothetical protein
MANKSIDPQIRFWKKVKKHDQCWIWYGALNRQGYGNFALSGSRSAPKTIAAHRFSYMLANGPIAESLHLDHLCRIRSCVNPSHLEAVSPGENLRRGDHPNMIAHKGGCCTRGHFLTPENTVTEKRSNGEIRYRCKECAKQREKNRKRITL